MGIRNKSVRAIKFGVYTNEHKSNRKQILQLSIVTKFLSELAIKNNKEEELNKSYASLLNKSNRAIRM